MSASTGSGGPRQEDSARWRLQQGSIGSGAGVEAGPTDGGPPRLELGDCLEVEKLGGGALVDDMLGEDEKKTDDNGEGQIWRWNRVGKDDDLRMAVASRRRRRRPDPCW